MHARSDDGHGIAVLGVAIGLLGGEHRSGVCRLVWVREITRGVRYTV
jgi:hypothetical protein